MRYCVWLLIGAAIAAAGVGMLRLSSVSNDLCYPLYFMATIVSVAVAAASDFGCACPNKSSLPRIGPMSTGFAVFMICVWLYLAFW